MVIIFRVFSKFEDFCTISPSFSIFEKILANLLELKFVQNLYFLHFGEADRDTLISIIEELVANIIYTIKESFIKRLQGQMLTNVIYLID